MLIGYMRVSKADGSQSTDLQRDALRAAGVATRRLYEDRASGRLDARPGLAQKANDAASVSATSLKRRLMGCLEPDGNDVTVANAPFATDPGVPLVVAKSKQMRFSDYGLKWEVSNKTGFFSPFSYQSA
jgi:Resolvase, N terminal domain